MVARGWSLKSKGSWRGRGGGDSFSASFIETKYYYCSVFNANSEGVRVIKLLISVCTHEQSRVSGIMQCGGCGLSSLLEKCTESVAQFTTPTTLHHSS